MTGIQLLRQTLQTIKLYNHRLLSASNVGVQEYFLSTRKFQFSQLFPYSYNLLSYVT